MQPDERVGIPPVAARLLPPIDDRDLHVVGVVNQGVHERQARGTGADDDVVAVRHRSRYSWSVEPVGLADHVDDAAHDLGQPEVLGGVDRGHPGLHQLAAVGVRDDPADDHRHVGQPASRSPSITAGTSSMCEPERIERPTQCTSSATAADTIWSGVSRMPW